MDLKKWKQEKGLIEEAYDTVYESDTAVTKPKFTSKERDRLMGIDKNSPKVTKVTVNTPQKAEQDDDSEESVKKEEVAEIEDPLGEPVEGIPGVEADISMEPDEVDAEIESLSQLLKNPDPERIDQYAQEGRLEDYIVMLQKKLDAAKAVKDVVRGKDGG